MNIEITVAIAAPSEPSAGNPKSPKIMIALRAVFVATEINPVTSGVFANPVLLSIAEQQLMIASAK